MSEKFRLGRKIGFQNTFYTKCINVIIDSIGPSIILRSISAISSSNGQLSLDKLKKVKEAIRICLIQEFVAESQPQNPEFRNNPEYFHP